MHIIIIKLVMAIVFLFSVMIPETIYEHVIKKEVSLPVEVSTEPLDLVPQNSTFLEKKRLNIERQIGPCIKIAMKTAGNYLEKG